jgi:ABC-type sulfate/molybdate transport systems ATPase subunit
VTHDAVDAVALAGDIVLLEDGRVTDRACARCVRGAGDSFGLRSRASTG